MKKENFVLKHLGRTFAVILSVILVFMIIGGALFSSLRSMLTVKSVTKMLKNIPYEEIIDKDSFEGTITDIAEKSGKNINVTGASMDNTIDDILESDSMKEVLSLYSKDATDAMTGNSTETRVSGDTVQEIFSDNSDELVAIISKNYPKLDESEIEKSINEIIDENFSDIASALPDSNEIKQEVRDLGVVKIFGFFLSNTALYVVWGAVLLMALLVFVCRLYRFKGLKWVGIDAIIASGVIISIAVIVGSELLLDVIDIEFVSSILSIFATKLYIIGGVVGGIGLALIAAAIVLHFLLKNKKNSEEAKQEEAEAKA